MAIEEKIIFDDSAVISGLRNQYDLITKANAAIRETELSYKEAFDIAKKQLDDTNKVIEKGTKAMGDHIASLTKSGKASSVWKEALGGIANGLKEAGVDVGKYVEKLKLTSNIMGTVAKAVNTGSGSLRVFKIALASTGIGFLVLALGALVGLLQKSSKVMETVNDVMAALGAVVRVLIDRFVKFTDSVNEILRGDFKKGFKDLADSTHGIGDAMIAAGTAAVLLERRIRALDDATRELSVTDELRKGQLQELENIYNNQLLGAGKRMDALIGENKIILASAEDHLRIEKEKLSIAIATNKQIIDDSQRNSSKEKDILAAATIAVQSAFNDRNAAAEGNKKKITGFQKEINDANQQANDKEIARIAALTKAFEDQVASITEASRKAELEKLSPEEKLQAEADFAKKQLGILVDRIQEEAKVLGKEIDLTQERANIEFAIEKDLQQKILALRKSEIEKNQKILNDAAKDRTELEKSEAKKRIEAISAEMHKAANRQKEIADKFEDPFQTALDNIKVKILNVFGLKGGSEEDLKKALESIKSSVSSIFGSITSGIDGAISKNDELIKSLQDQQKELDKDLEKELERQREGLANSVDAKQKERTALMKEELKAEKERDKLRKKQLIAQLIADSASQISNLVTMGSAIVKEEGKKGLLGVPFALAAVAAMFALFASIKTAAAGASKKFYTGGSLEESGGFVNENGRTDMNGGRGHRIEDSNIVVGGKEFIVNESASSKHRELLEAINNGEFDSGPGLRFAVNHTKEIHHGQDILNAHIARNKDKAFASAVDEAVGKHIRSLEKTIKSQVRRTSYSPGDIIIEESENSKKIIKTEDSWIWKP